MCIDFLNIHGDKVDCIQMMRFLHGNTSDPSYIAGDAPNIKSPQRKLNQTTHAEETPTKTTTYTEGHLSLIQSLRDIHLGLIYQTYSYPFQLYQMTVHDIFFYLRKFKMAVESDFIFD